LKPVENKFGKLKTVIASYGSALVAFSGGCDSAFVLKVARDVLGRPNVKAVTAKSPSIAGREFEEAKRLAREFDAEHMIVETDEIARPDYRSNPPERCFFCKEALYERLLALAAAGGFRTVCNGANADDLDDWRPGHRAAEKFSVRSPLIEAGFSKRDVREHSKRLGLPTWAKPASPCLASRIPYGEAITPEKLTQIERAEDFLRDLNFSCVRVRHHGPVARLEFDPKDFERLRDDETRKEIVRALKAFGFHYVALDLEGFRSGSLNEVK